MRHIFKASATLGLGSMAVILTGIVRAKTIAVVLGPEGVGRLGMLLTLVSLLSTLVGLGLNNAGVRYIAAAREDGENARAAAAKGLIAGVHVLGVIGAVAVLAAAPFLTDRWPSGPPVAAWGAWTALALWATVAGQGHLAFLNGDRRVAEYTRVNALGAVLGTAVTVPLVLADHPLALGFAVAAVPVATLALSVWVSRDAWPLLRAPSAVGRVWRASLGGMLRLGVTFAASLAVSAAVQFLARVVLETHLGKTVSGYYQATYSLTQMYLGFVLSALAAEYYPRLSGMLHDPPAMARAVHDQMRMVLALVAPIIAVSILIAPLLVRLLYDPTFLPMIPLLRWQFVGDGLKLGSWAFAFFLLAREERARYFVMEASWALLYAAGVYVVATRYSFVYISLVYILCYALYLAASVGFAAQVAVLHRPWMSVGRTVLLTLALAAEAALSSLDGLGEAAALALAVGIGAWALYELHTMMDLRSRWQSARQRLGAPSPTGPSSTGPFSGPPSP